MRSASIQPRAGSEEFVDHGALRSHARSSAARFVVDKYQPSRGVRTLTRSRLRNRSFVMAVVIFLFLGTSLAVFSEDHKRVTQVSSAGGLGAVSSPRQTSGTMSQRSETEEARLPQIRHPISDGGALSEVSSSTNEDGSYQSSIYDPRWAVDRYQQTMTGSFSAVSKPMFVSKQY